MNTIKLTDKELIELQQQTMNDLIRLMTGKKMLKLGGSNKNDNTSKR